MLNIQIAFATSSIRSLKMIEAGVPKDKLGMLNAPFQIVQILTPIFFGNLVVVSKPLDLFLKIYPVRMIVTLILVLWVYCTPLFRDDNDQYPWSFFILYGILNGGYSLVFSSLSLTRTLFYTQISDKSIGGTYMTLLNTISNIGQTWPGTLALYLIDVLSVKHCEKIPGHPKPLNTSEAAFLALAKETNLNTCSNQDQIEVSWLEFEINNWCCIVLYLIYNVLLFFIKSCIKLGARCLVLIDAFYLLTVVAVALGLFWLLYFKSSILKLQSLPKSGWRVDSSEFTKRTQYLMTKSDASLLKNI